MNRKSLAACARVSFSGRAVMLLLAASLIGLGAIPAYALSVRTSDEANPIATLRESFQHATKSIDLVVYKFDERSIAKALEEAIGRGVEVRIIADAGEFDRKHGRVKSLAKAGARVRRWRRGKLHAKFGIIDGERVITGSFNLTESAQHDNLELLIVVGDLGEVEQFRERFERMWDAAGT